MKRLFVSIITCLLSAFLFANESAVFRIDSITPNGIVLDQKWKFHAGDDTAWMRPGFDDSAWESIGTRIVTDRENKTSFHGIGWFRLHVHVNPSLAGVPLALSLNQHGASEIYLDGRLIYIFGTVSSDRLKEYKYNPQGVPYPIVFPKGGSHVLAVRYSNTDLGLHYDDSSTPNAGFVMRLFPLRHSIDEVLEQSMATAVIFTFLFTFFTALAILHFLLYIFYRKNISNLYYSIFAAGIGYVLFTTFIASYNSSTSQNETIESINGIVLMLSFLSLLALIYSIFYKRFPLMFRITAAAAAVALTLLYSGLEQAGMLVFSIYFIIAIELIRVVVVSLRKKREGARIIGTGVVTFMAFMVMMVISMLSGHVSLSTSTTAGMIFFFLVILSIISIPLSMTVYLARDFARTSNNLQVKLEEVERLSAKTIEQEKEKQKILESQKEVLETQVQERTAEIVEQKKIIEEKNKDITDSINYARRIQNAIRPSSEVVQKVFTDSFALYKPKDIVSGDFYFYEESAPYHIVACADCTGHGVPGAFMSLIGSNLLTQIIKEKNITIPGQILDHLHEGIRKTLKQDSERTGSKDGMDIALLAFDFGGKQVHYAGAQRPLWMIRDGKLEEIRADKFSIGGLQMEAKRTFTNHVIDYKNGDCFYLSSDGFADQFGGPHGKKFMSKRFKDLLLSIHEKPMPEQWRILNRAAEEWRGGTVQVDDILVIGIRV
ncbi:MAG: SpoIIE family protein phosphatase [Bacteroidota bacterium]